MPTPNKPTIAAVLLTIRQLEQQLATCKQNDHSGNVAATYRHLATMHDLKNKLQRGE